MTITDDLFVNGDQHAHTAARGASEKTLRALAHFFAGKPDRLPGDEFAPLESVTVRHSGTEAAFCWPFLGGKFHGQEVIVEVTVGHSRFYGELFGLVEFKPRVNGRAKTLKVGPWAARVAGRSPAPTFNRDELVEHALFLYDQCINGFQPAVNDAVRAIREHLTGQPQPKPVRVEDLIVADREFQRAS